MKKIISVLLLLCVLSALFGCGNEPEVTGTEQSATDTLPEIIDTETTAPDTETDSQTTAEITAEQTTEETGADTEPSQEFYKAYKIYDPAMAGDDFSGSIFLYKNGRYTLEWNSHVNKTPLYKVLLEYTEEGEYEIYDDAGELSLYPTELTYFIETDKNKQYKTEYLNEIEELYSSGDVSKEAYDIIFLISFGITILPSSSIGRDIPVKFIIFACLFLYFTIFCHFLQHAERIFSQCIILYAYLIFQEE